MPISGRSPILATVVAVMALVVAGRASAGHGAASPPVLVLPPEPFVTIREVPTVSYGPQLPTDVFQYRGRYYTWQNGWYVTNKPGKPWVAVQGNRVPQPVLLVPANYYKRLPPGQAKKLYGSGPPGHGKHHHDHDHDDHDRDHDDD